MLIRLIISMIIQFVGTLSEIQYLWFTRRTSFAGHPETRNKLPPAQVEMYQLHIQSYKLFGLLLYLLEDRPPIIAPT